ncbi:MAG: beta-lactamase family protein [Planctomyces sp.]|nr:beta-lactamase family protein [Planctomyces sp.]
MSSPAVPDSQVLIVRWILIIGICLAGLTRPGLAQNSPPRGSSSQQSVTEGTPEREKPRRGISVEEMKPLIDKAIAEKQIVTNLKARIAKRKIVFDVTLGPNAEEEPWIILLNLTDEKFAASNKEYAADGYRVLVDNTIVANKQQLHSVVWVRDAEQSTEVDLQLPPGEIPSGGSATPDLPEVSKMMVSFLRDHNVPGATLAISKDGSVIYSRSFGYSKLEPLQQMAPETQLRIASISKPITAVAILQLVEGGLITLDTRVLDVLNELDALKGRNGEPLSAPTDVRWQKITVRDLLHHSGGWDRSVSKDPMFQVAQITQKKRLLHTATTYDIIRNQLEQPLDFEPGSKTAYSNFGYCLLGRIIERVTGKSYADYVTEKILVPSGMKRTQLGKTRFQDRTNTESQYFTQRKSQHPAFWEALVGTKRSTLPEVVPAPYGQWDLEVMDSHGGWISTSEDLLNFSAALERDESPLLSSESRAIMLERPAFDQSGESSWYGCGWNVRRVGTDGVNFWHVGGLAGTSTLLVRRSDGYAWAVLFNIDETKDSKRCSDIIDPLIHHAVDRSHPAK